MTFKRWKKKCIEYSKSLGFVYKEETGTVNLNDGSRSLDEIFDLYSKMMAYESYNVSDTYMLYLFINLMRGLNTYLVLILYPPSVLIVYTSSS